MAGVCGLMHSWYVLTQPLSSACYHWDGWALQRSQNSPKWNEVIYRSMFVKIIQIWNHDLWPQMTYSTSRFHPCHSNRLILIISYIQSKHWGYFHPQHKDAKNFENYLDPALLVFIGKLSLSSLRWVPYGRVSIISQVFCIICIGQISHQQHMGWSKKCIHIPLDTAVKHGHFECNFKIQRKFSYVCMTLKTLFGVSRVTLTSGTNFTKVKENKKLMQDKNIKNQKHSKRLSLKDVKVKSKYVCGKPFLRKTVSKSMTFVSEGSFRQYKGMEWYLLFKRMHSISHHSSLVPLVLTRSDRENMTRCYVDNI